MISFIQFIHYISFVKWVTWEAKDCTRRLSAGKQSQYESQVRNMSADVQARQSLHADIRADQDDWEATHQILCLLITHTRKEFFNICYSTL